MIERRTWLKVSAAGLATFAAAPARAVSPTLVQLRTGLGTILVTLELARAPVSAGAFLRCVSAGAYTGGAFTRVVRPDNDHGSPIISVVQGAVRPGVSLPGIRHESTRQTGLSHKDGVISLARDAVGTATGGAFFICVGDQTGLDFGGMRNKDAQGFAAFGQVTQGMEIVRRIWAMRADGPSADAYTSGQMLAPPVPITAASRLG